MTQVINKEFKELLETKIWEEVSSRADYGDDVVRNNHIVVEWGGLTYDIYFTAWVSTYMYSSYEYDWRISEMDIDNVTCYVADFVNDEDDCFEKEISIVLDHMSGLELKE